MNPLTFMLIAGEPSGDLLAAELVRQLRAEWERRSRSAGPGSTAPPRPFAPHFFGAGGSKMAEAGVDLAVDMMAHAVVGLVDVVKSYGRLRRLFHQLLDQAIARQPDAIICVDYPGFNRPFAGAVRRYLERRAGPFFNWRPRIVHYVSPQVWASRPWRAKRMARDLDLLLSIFPFEKEWFAQQTPKLPVVYVGHPLIDRYAAAKIAAAGPGRALPSSETAGASSGSAPAAAPNRAPEKPAPRGPLPLVLLLPGSRVSELKHHLPVMLRTAGLIGADWPSVRFRMVLPNESLMRMALDQAAVLSRKPLVRSGGDQWPASIAVDLGRFGVRTIELSNGGLMEAFREATVAIASTGTVTMECAYFGMPTVAMYKTLSSNYHLAKRLILVKYLAMPNLLLDEAVFPEFIQHEATPQNIAREALDLLESPERREQIKSKLANAIASLGPPGAGERAAQAVWDLLLVR